MKITYKGATPRLDMEYDSANCGNIKRDLLEQEIRTEYWNTLFKNCGNTHPFRTAFAQRASLESRKLETMTWASKNDKFMEV